MSVGTAVRVRTYAKVNLFLRVLGTRADGFHELETILHVVKLHDSIDIDVTPGQGVAVSMEASAPYIGDLPDEGSNLVYVAAQKLIEHAPVDMGARINVRKSIPIGAGLGGGSGNAAGILSVLSELWSMQLEREALQDLAADVGSDVPFCIEGGTALATARGEVLTSLPTPSDMWFVLGGTARSLSTRDVYAAWDDLGPTEGPSSASMTLALGAGDVGEVGQLLHNDLEPAAFTLMPELAAKKEAMGGSGALGAAMSGSGPTMFGVARDRDHAVQIAAAVEKDFDWVEVVQSGQACVERLDAP